VTTSIIDDFVAHPIITKAAALTLGGVLSWGGFTLVNDHTLNATQDIKISELQKQTGTILDIQKDINEIKVDTARVEERTRFYEPILKKPE